MRRLNTKLHALHCCTAALGMHKLRHVGCGMRDALRAIAVGLCRHLRALRLSRSCTSSAEKREKTCSVGSRWVGLGQEAEAEEPRRGDQSNFIFWAGCFFGDAIRPSASLRRRLILAVLLSAARVCVFCIPDLLFNDTISISS